jgi:cytoskeletal protein RodZ
MAKKAFDILPPRKKEIHHHPGRIAEKVKKKSGKTFWSLIFGLFLIIVIYLFVKNSEILNPSLSSKPSTSSTSSSSFELFNPEGDSTLTQNPIKIQIINASAGTVAYQDVANILVKQGFTIQKTGEDTNSRTETIINYRSNFLPEAQKAQNILSTKFIVTLSEKNDLDQNIDLSITIGKSK